MLAKHLQKILSNIQEITVDELLKKMQENKPFYLIDVREEAEWRLGTIPEANCITRGTLELHLEKLTSDEQADIVLYCGGGTRSALATDSLEAMGYKNVKSLKGGFRAWKEKSLATTTTI